MADRIVGFIGLGIMGKPMARNVMEAGYDLVVYNRTREKAEEISGDGATVADSPREVAEGSDVVITMLPDSPDVWEVVSGENGVLEGIEEGALLVDMSTISPVVTRELAKEVEERGASMLDAPVSGGDVGAQEGTLSIMVGGGEEDFERARPLFEVMGETITHVGPSGAGQTAKTANQIVVALTIGAVAEGLLFASRAGADPAKVRQALMGGLATSRILDILGERMIKRTFDPGFRIALHQKDLNLALQSARAMGLSLPNTATCQELFNSCTAHGGSAWDHSGMVRALEFMANHEIGKSAGE